MRAHQRYCNPFAMEATSLSTPGSPKASRAPSARRSDPAERPLSISTQFNVRGIAIQRLIAGLLQRLRNLWSLSCRQFKTAGSKRYSFPASFDSMISTSSGHWALDGKACSEGASFVVLRPTLHQANGSIGVVGGRNGPHLRGVETVWESRNGTTLRISSTSTKSGSYRSGKIAPN